jgi:magnesium and cobalt exporter, CNNM family
VTLFLELVGVALLIGLNAFFVAAEYGLVTVRRTRMAELEAEGNKRAALVLRITNDPPRFVAAMQLGVTLTSLGIGALGEQALAHAFRPLIATPLAVALAFLIISYAHVVVGELVPKGIALGHSDGTALHVALPVRIFFTLFHPFTWVLMLSTKAVLGIFGMQPPGAEREAYTEAELKMLVHRSTETGEIEHDEREMLYKVFDFAEKEASDVMVPRPQVVALSIDLPPEECLAAVIDSPYTRYPVYRESLDDIVGVLHVRDLFSAMNELGIASVRVADIIRPAHIVPETKDLAALLAEFRRANQHMAIVVDEYGATEGIVTLEDILEEIVGEIEDEYDLPDESIEQVDETTIRIHGTFPIDDFNEQFDHAIPIEDYHTIAGFVFGMLGHQPAEGDEVSYDGVRFRVLDVEGSRIERLEVEFLPPPEAEEEQRAAEG